MLSNTQIGEQLDLATAGAVEGLNCLATTEVAKVSGRYVKATLAGDLLVVARAKVRRGRVTITSVEAIPRSCIASATSYGSGTMDVIVVGSAGVVIPEGLALDQILAGV